MTVSVKPLLERIAFSSSQEWISIPSTSPVQALLAGSLISQQIRNDPPGFNTRHFRKSMLQVTPEVDSLESSDRIERIIRIGKSVDSSCSIKQRVPRYFLFFYAQRWHSPMKYLCHTLSLAGNVAISVANWHHHRNRCQYTPFRLPLQAWHSPLRQWCMSCIHPQSIILPKKPSGFRKFCKILLTKPLLFICLLI